MTSTSAHAVLFPLSNLPAVGPHPAYRAALMLFGQFVGVWEMDITFFDDQGHLIFHGPGRWEFAWVLDGRAVQDVLVYADMTTPAATEVGERRTGTTVRQYLPATGRWRIVWVGATSATLVVLEGGPAGDDIVLEGPEGDTAQLRWRFTAITADRFRWQGLISHDNGVTWRMEQEMTAHRQSDGAAT